MSGSQINLQIMISTQAKRRYLWIGFLVLTVPSIFLAGSYYASPIRRSRLERAMNRNLVGYHTHRETARLRLFDGTLLLYGLYVSQEAHPTPPVEIPMLRVSIQWRQLLLGRIVADCLLSQPTASINLI